MYWDIPKGAMGQVLLLSGGGRGLNISASWKSGVLCENGVEALRSRRTANIPARVSSISHRVPQHRVPNSSLLLDLNAEWP